jgi:PAS domain S-box-containing protein
MSDQTDTILNFINSTDAIIYLKDEEGRFLMMNRKGAEMAGVSQEEIIGKTDYDIVPKEYADRFRAFDRQVADSGVPSNYRAEVKYQSGDKKFKVLDHKFPVSVKGHPKSVGGIAIEIPEDE